MPGYALRLNNGVDTAVRVRMGDAMPLLSDGGVGARSGFRNDGGAEVAVVAGTMGITVSPFTCWVDGGTSAAQGGYPFILDAEAGFTLADGHATLSRTDTVAVRIRDDAFDGSGSTDADLIVVQGTPGAGVPALPATALPVRDVIVPATASAGTGGLSSGNLSTDRRIYLPSGVVRVASAVERDSLVVEAGTVAYRADTDVLQVWNGATWKTYTPDDTTTYATAAALGLTLNSGFTAASLKAVRKGNDRYLSLRIASVNAINTYTTLGTMPADWRPAGAPATGTIGFGGAGTAPYTRITTAGNLDVASITVAAGGQFEMSFAYSVL